MRGPALRVQVRVLGPSSEVAGGTFVKLEEERQIFALVLDGQRLVQASESDLTLGSRMIVGIVGIARDIDTSRTRPVSRGEYELSVAEVCDLQAKWNGRH